MKEKRLEDYVVRGLVDFDDIDYEKHSELLYELARQTVDHLRGYLAEDEEVGKVLQSYQKDPAGTVDGRRNDIVAIDPLVYREALL